MTNCTFKSVNCALENGYTLTGSTVTREVRISSCMEEACSGSGTDSQCIDRLRLEARYCTQNSHLYLEAGTSFNLSCMRTAVLEHTHPTQSDRASKAAQGPRAASPGLGNRFVLLNLLADASQHPADRHLPPSRTQSPIFCCGTVVQS
jgi:hypothetical protein